METLVALAVLALLTTGLATAGRLLAREEESSAELGAEADGLLGIRKGLASVIENAYQAPTSALKGDARHVEGNCASTCEISIVAQDAAASLTLRIGASARTWRLPRSSSRFSYITSAGSFDRWPTGRPDNADAGDPLLRVVLSDGDVTLSSPIPVKPSPDCDYDLITRDCRPAKPT